MKYLALDIGSRKIGFAISDAKGIIAEPLGVIDRKQESPEITFEQLVALCREKKIEHLVVGVPYSGKESQQNEYRQLAARIAEARDIPWSEWDETFSTKEAQNVVGFAESLLKKKKTKDHRDAVAAAVILQEYLDNEARKKKKQDGPENS